MSPDSIKLGVKSDIFNDNPKNIPPEFFDGINVIVGVNLDQFSFLLIILDKVIDSVGRHLLVLVEVQAILIKSSHLRNKNLSDLVGNTINFDPAILSGINHSFSNLRIKSMKLLYEFGYTSLLEFLQTFLFSFHLSTSPHGSLLILSPTIVVFGSTNPKPLAVLPSLE